MTLLFKISAVSLIFIGCAVFLRQYRPEYVFLLRISAIFFIAYLLLSEATSFINELNDILNYFNVSSFHLSLLLKVGLVAVLSDFIIDTLEESGDSSLAGIVGLSSKLIIISFSFPVIKGLLVLCRDLIK